MKPLRSRSLLLAAGLLAGCILLFPSAASARDDEAEQTKFITAYASAHAFNGTVLVQQDGEVRYRKSFGLANIPFKVPNTDRTKYWIASITKLFTSTLVLQLHEHGKIDLDGTIADYLPDYAGEGARKVSIRNLLNHTSGIRNFDRVTTMEQALASGMPTYQAPYSSDELLAKFCSGPLVHAPGAVFDYNNGDYIILGKIIERVGGKPYADVLRERILQPLGMDDTGLLRQRDIVAGRPDTYFWREDIKALVPDLPVYPENWYAAGAMYSTADDVLAFSNALFGGRLLRQETLALMTRPDLDDYGFGLWVYDTNVAGKPRRVAKRPGRIMGAQAQLYRFLDQDLTIVVLSNTGTTDLDEFVAEIGKQMAH